MELHILFFILAGLLIAVLVGFSLWSARREKSRIFSNTFTTRAPATPINHNHQVAHDIPETLQSQNYQYENSAYAATQSFEESPQEIQQEVESSLRDIKISLPGQEQASYNNQTAAAPIYGSRPVAQPAPVQQPIQAQPMQQPVPSFTAQPIQPEPVSVLEQSVEELQCQAEQGDVVLYSDNSVREQLAQNSMQPAAESAPQAVEPKMITLYVVAPENQAFNGEFVVQSLEALGLQYGEYQIFHRHQLMGNSSSPVIFSVANMMQPGIFDLNKLQQFSTIGLVLFMHLPSEGNDIVNLKLLLKTAENLAQSLGGFVLNEQRELFDENARRAYLSRV